MASTRSNLNGSDGDLGELLAATACPWRSWAGIGDPLQGYPLAGKYPAADFLVDVLGAEITAAVFLLK